MAHRSEWKLEIRFSGTWRDPSVLCPKPKDCLEIWLELPCCISQGFVRSLTRAAIFLFKKNCLFKLLINISFEHPKLLVCSIEFCFEGKRFIYCFISLLESQWAEYCVCLQYSNHYKSLECYINCLLLFFFSDRLKLYLSFNFAEDTK